MQLESINYGVSLLKFVDRMPDQMMAKNGLFTLSWEMDDGFFLSVVFEAGERFYWFTSDMPRETNYIDCEDLVDLINSLI